jgi:hypothetical protein
MFLCPISPTWCCVIPSEAERQRRWQTRSTCIAQRRGYFWWFRRGLKKRNIKCGKFDAMILPEPVKLIKRATELLYLHYARENGRDNRVPVAH